MLAPEIRAQTGHGKLPESKSIGLNDLRWIKGDPGSRAGLYVVGIVSII
jgi:hypothetical protein